MKSPHATSQWKAWLLLAVALWMGLVPGWAVMIGAGNYAYGADSLGGGTTRLDTADCVVQSTSALVDTINRTDVGACVPDFTYEAVATSIRFEDCGSLVLGADFAENSYILSGEQWDQDLGLYYNRARHLNTDSGRFWNQDEYEGGRSDPQSLHKYLYAHANPVTGFDPSGHFTLTEMMQAVQIVGILARIAVPAITRIGFSVAHRLAAAALRPLFVFAGGLPIVTQVGQRLSVFDRFTRFFITPTQGYAPVAPWLSDMFQMMGVRLQQGHVFIQQAWYRAGSPNQWYPGDTAANLGMQRLANAGFNLLAMPGGLNRTLGANNLQGSVGTTVVAGGVVTGTASSIAWALDNLRELITGPEADEEPPPATP